MIRYSKAQGVQIPSAALGAIHFTPEGVAMGAVPGWKMFLDPSYMVSGAPRNRAVKQSVTTAPEGPITINTFRSTQEAAFRMYNNTIGTRSIRGLPAVNPNRWSFFIPFSLPSSTGLSLTEIFRSNVLSEAGELCLRIAMTANGDVVIYEGTTVDRLRWTPAVSLVDSPALLMFTFSTDGGLNIFANGVRVASAADFRPLTEGFGAGEWRMFGNSNTRCDAGMIGMLDLDLSTPENAGYRRAIEQFLMTKYGLG